AGWDGAPARGRPPAPGRVPRAPALLRPAGQPADPTHHLAARPWPERALERGALGLAPGRRLVRGREPGRALALLVGRGGTDRRPRADAEDPGAHAAVAPRRHAADLRVRRQH